MMLKPETLAVMEPSVEAARAVVDRCPMETTEAMTSEYSSKCVLCVTSLGLYAISKRADGTYPKTGRVYFAKILASSRNISLNGVASS